MKNRRIRENYGLSLIMTMIMIKIELQNCNRILKFLKENIRKKNLYYQRNKIYLKIYDKLMEKKIDEDENKELFASKNFINIKE